MFTGINGRMCRLNKLNLDYVPLLSKIFDFGLCGLLKHNLAHKRQKIAKTYHATFSFILLMTSNLLFADELSDLIVIPKLKTISSTAKSSLAVNDEVKSYEIESSVVSNNVIAARLWPSSIYTRLTLEAEHEINIKHTVKDKPLCLNIDIDSSSLNSVLKSLNTKVLAIDPLIDNIKVNQLTNNTVRVVIYLKQPTRIQTKMIPPVNLGSVNYKYRYVFDMYPEQNIENDDPNDDLLALLQLKNDQFESTANVLKNIASMPSLATKLYPEFKAMPNKTKYKGKKLIVMLDPGHGGEDPGAIGPSGAREKNIVLGISKALQQLINQTNHMEAHLTRDQDVFIPLGTRVKIARKAKADLFISIHADAVDNRNARGSSVYTLSERGASSSFARWLAKSQNNADLIGGVSFKTKDKMVNQVLLDMAQTWTMKTSSKLGQMLLGQMGNVNRLHKKQVERAAFAVLKAPDIPSALVETAFISNPQEEEMLTHADSQQKIAMALFNSINSFSLLLRLHRL